ncbi:MAG: glucose-1-phosphate adenylyltransferase [Gammaproteobacteria bacterium]|jgi:glucose-1-phosphate adenylyltransferase
MAQQRIPHTERFVSLITRDTLALILAGGKGVRLGGLTRNRVKPAVPFGGRFRLIDFPLSNCINSGIRRIGVLTQYKAHVLVQHIQQGWNFLRSELGEYVELLPAQQRMGEEWYRGTADAVYQNADIVSQHDPHFVLVLGGDHIYKMDYGRLVGFHVSRGADVTVACMPVPLAEASEFGVMAVDEEYRILRFEEKPETPEPMPDDPSLALASMGIYVFNTDYLLASLNADAQDADSTHDFGHDVIPAAVETGRVYGFPFLDPVSGKRLYWRDVGSLDSYWRANLELLDVQPELNLYDRNWPIWTLQEQSPPAKFVFDEDARRGAAYNSMVAGGCIVSGAIVRHSLLFSFVVIEEGSLVENAIVISSAHIGRNCRIRNAVIDAGTHLPDGTVIGHDEASDRERFEVTPAGLVLVTPEMLGQVPRVY